jgi:signal transduction histidine kinase
VILRWPSLSAMSRSLAAAGVLVLAACGLLVNALVGGEVVEMPPTLLLFAAGGYAAGAWAPPRLAGPAVVVAASALTAASQIVSPGDYPVLDDLVFFLVAIGGPALAGAAVAGRARQVRALRGLAERIAGQREAEVRSAQAEERTRVEVGLHRRFSEDLAAIAMRAESVRGRPDDDVRGALAEIEQAARGTLDRLREALGTLQDADGGPPRPAPLPEPAPDTLRVRTPELPVTPTPGEVAQPRSGRSDVALGVACGLALVVETVVSSATRGPVTAGVIVALAIGGFVVVHRTRALVSVVGVLTAFTVLDLWLTPPTELVSTLLALTVVAYALGAHTRGAARWVGSAVLAAWMVGLELTGRPATDVDAVLAVLVWVGLAVLAGVVTSGWGVRAQQLQALVSELERGREVELQLAVAEQRARLAHDLHDTVAHALTVVCLQASAGQVEGRVGPGQLGPGQLGGDRCGGEVIDVVIRSARTGLRELREGLDGLGDAQALAVEELTAQARRAGVHPEISVSGPVESLPASVRLLAARVSRESLVNAGRYAPGSRVTVALEVADRLQLDIRDSGGAASTWAQGAGTGLQALRVDVERAGGTLVWGLTPQGFRVSATMPVEEVLV